MPQYFILLAVLFFYNCNSHSVHQICSLYKSLNRENKGMFKKSAKAYTEKINSSKYYRWQKFLLRRNYSIHLSRPSPLKNEIRSNPLSLFILFVDIWVSLFTSWQEKHFQPKNTLFRCFYNHIYVQLITNKNKKIASLRHCHSHWLIDSPDK